MPQRFVRPAKHEVLVAKPGGALLAVAGETVEWTTYWQKILNDGDIVVFAEEPVAPSGEAGAAATDRRRAR